ncbi:MAG: hypothetical protein MOGDAGHF_01106 [Rhodocyclaceae bacterium]|nr:hypothetical protein [Rhodocyclaceae bacterium]
MRNNFVNKSGTYLLCGFLFVLWQRTYFMSQMTAKMNRRKQPSIVGMELGDQLFSTSDVTCLDQTND